MNEKIYQIFKGIIDNDLLEDFSDKRKNESKKRTGDSEELYSNDTNNDEKLYPQATDTKDRVCRKIKAMLTKKLF